MSDKGIERDPIEPALTAQEWGPMPPRLGTFTIGNTPAGLEPRVSISPDGMSIRDEWSDASEAPLAVVIALANHALRDDDRRKITRDKIDMLRSAADSPRSAYANSDELHAFADALASYLPPEST